MERESSGAYTHTLSWVNKLFFFSSEESEDRSKGRDLQVLTDCKQNIGLPPALVWKCVGELGLGEVGLAHEFITLIPISKIVRQDDMRQFTVL